MNNPQPPLTIMDMYADHDPYNYRADRHWVLHVRMEVPSFQPLGIQNAGSGVDPNKSFTEALSKALNKEDRIVVVHGAPGTGKTEFLATVIKLYASQGKKTIVITPNDSTFSSLLQKTIHQSTTTVLNLPLGEEASENIKHYTVKDFLYSRRDNSFAPSHCIIDDASHVVLANVLPLLHHCQKVIMAGDPRQFPLLPSDNRDEVRHNVMQLRSRPSLIPVVFHHHRRSNAEIFKWSSKRNYPKAVLAQDRQLKPILNTQIRLQPVMMLDTGLENGTNFCEKYRHGMRQNHGYYNEGEVIVVKRHIEYLCRNYVISNDDIAVIATTLAQVELVKQNVNCKVGLLEDFQGREFKVIIFSAVKRNPFRYFADLTLQRLEYIISRAICHFAYVGCAYTMLNDELNSIAWQWKAENCRLHPVTYEVDTSHIENVFRVYRAVYKEFFESCHEHLKNYRIRDQEPDHVVRKLMSQYRIHLSKAERRLFTFDAEDYYLEFIENNSDGLIFQFFTETEQSGTITLGLPVIVVSFDDQTTQVEEICLSGICYPGRTLSTTCFVPNSNQMAIHFNKKTNYWIVPDDSQLENTRYISFRTILLKDHLLQRLPKQKDRHVVFHGELKYSRARLVEYIAGNFLTETMVVTAIDDDSLSDLYRETQEFLKERQLVLDEVIMEDELFKRANISKHAEHVKRSVEKWREWYMEAELEFEALHQFTAGIVNNFYKLFARRIESAISKTKVLFCAINSPFINLFSQIERKYFNPEVCLISEASQLNQMQTWPIAWTSKKVLMAGELNGIPKATYLSIQCTSKEHTVFLPDRSKKDSTEEEIKEHIVSLQDKFEKDTSDEESEEQIVSLEDKSKKDSSEEQSENNSGSLQDEPEEYLEEESEEAFFDAESEKDVLEEEPEEDIGSLQDEFNAGTEVDFYFLQDDSEEISSEDESKKDSTEEESKKKIDSLEDESEKDSTEEETKEQIVSLQDKSEGDTSGEESKKNIDSLEDESEKDSTEEETKEQIVSLQDKSEGDTSGEESKKNIDSLEDESEKDSTEEETKEQIVSLQDKSEGDTSGEESKKNIDSLEDESEKDSTEEETKEQIVSLQDKSEGDTSGEESKKNIDALEDKSKKDSTEEETKEQIVSLQDKFKEDSLLTHLFSINNENLRWRLCTETRLNGQSVYSFSENTICEDGEHGLYLVYPFGFLSRRS